MKCSAQVLLKMDLISLDFLFLFQSAALLLKKASCGWKVNAKCTFLNSLRSLRTGTNFSIARVQSPKSRVSIQSRFYVVFSLLPTIFRIFYRSSQPSWRKFAWKVHRGSELISLRISPANQLTKRRCVQYFRPSDHSLFWFPGFALSAIIRSLSTSLLVAKWRSTQSVIGNDRLFVFALLMYDKKEEYYVSFRIVLKTGPLYMGVWNHRLFFRCSIVLHRKISSWWFHNGKPPKCAICQALVWVWNSSTWQDRSVTAPLVVFLYCWVPSVYSRSYSSLGIFECLSFDVTCMAWFWKISVA